MKLPTKIVLFIGIAAVSNVAVVLAMPWLISHVVMHEIVASALANARHQRNSTDPPVRQRARLVLVRGGYDVALTPAPATAKSRIVVRPSPDLLYTACVFDLSKHALRIRAPVQESYVSVSGFAADSSNFFVEDGRSQPVDAGGKRHFDLVLEHNGQVVKPPPGVRVIHSPSTTGLVLFRSLITDRKALPRLQQFYQAHQTCNPM